MDVTSSYMDAFIYGFHFFGTKIAVSFALLWNLEVSRKPAPDLFAILLSKRILVEIFLSIRVLPYDVTW